MLLLVSILSYLVVGVISGALAGLLGISGGVVTVPVLFFLFRLLGFPQDNVMQIAIGTSLAAMVFNALSSSLVHAHKKAVLWQVCKNMTPGIILGSLIGALIGDLLSSDVLKLFFALFSCLLGLQFMRPSFSFLDKKHRTPSKMRWGVYGTGIALISNLLGIGGGILTVPTLIYHHIPEKQAIGTSAATGVLITFIGALFYLYFGMNERVYPHTLGFIYLPAFFIISFISVIAARYGAILSNHLSPPLLRRIFGVVLLMIGLLMFF